MIIFLKNFHFSNERVGLTTKCTSSNKKAYFLFININKLDALNFLISLFQASTCFEHMCSSSGGHGTATYRCDDTRDCVIQFCPPDDEHMCSKHVEVWNKLIKKFSASSWLILINKYIDMHGQQNIKKNSLLSILKIIEVEKNVILVQLFLY